MAPPPVERSVVIAILQIAQQARENYQRIQAMFNDIGLPNYANDMDQPLQQIEDTVKVAIRDNTLY
jgi:hypothetical protein